MTDPYRKPPEGEPLIVLGSGEPGTGNSRIFAVSITTGATLWETTLPTTYASGPSTMAIGDGLIVVVTGDGKVFCVDHQTGQALWSQEVWRRDRTNSIEPLVVIADSKVIVGLHGLVTCFDRSGVSPWTSQLGTAALGFQGRVVEVH